MNTLPKEIINIIVHYLSLINKIRLSQTCKSFQTHLKDQIKKEKDLIKWELTIIYAENWIIKKFDNIKGSRLYDKKSEYLACFHHKDNKEIVIRYVENTLRNLVSEKGTIIFDRLSNLKIIKHTIQLNEMQNREVFSLDKNNYLYFMWYQPSSGTYTPDIIMASREKRKIRGAITSCNLIIFP